MGLFQAMEASLTKSSYHQLRKQLSFQLRYWPTALVMLADLALLCAAFYLATRDSWWAYAAAQPLFVLVFFHNFAILHEAGHGNLSKREFVNTLTGYYASLFCFLPYFPWKFIHAEHHTWAGNVQKDPTLKLVRDFEASAHIKNSLLKFAWRSWLPLLALGQHIVFWTYPLSLLREGRLQGQRLRRAITSVLLLGITYTALYLLFPTVFNLRVFGPSLFVYLVCVELINFPHHLGAGLFHHTEHHDRLPLWEQASVTRSCYYPPLLADLLLMNFNFHIEHHLFPDLPWYRLTHARVLAKAALGDEYRESIGIEWNLEHRGLPLEDVVLVDSDGRGAHWNLARPTPEPTTSDAMAEPTSDEYDQLLEEVRLLKAATEAPATPADAPTRSV
ncbi:MAG TPA: fatty acid desaturase [Pirellulaceae bacterium]|nr:fatty acid desaturase [Pirellulaceae bacterium]